MASLCLGMRISLTLVKCGEVKRMTQKIVINACYGGFGVSIKAFERYLDLKGITYYKWKNSVDMNMLTTVPQNEYDEYNNDHFLSLYHIKRDDPVLIQIIEEMGVEADGHYAELKIIEIPDDVKWYIEDYDGMEHVAEVHRTWP
jgi:hypothetical protein